VLDPDFGKVFQCSACGPFQQERRRRKVLQAMQPLMDAYSMLEGELLGKTFKNFELAPRVQAAHKAVRSWALAIYRDEVTKPFLYLFGPTGVGKSHLGAAAANALVSTHTSVMFTTFTELLGMLSADNYRHKERGIKAMQDIPVLILDDIRAGDLTSDWSTNVLFRVLDRRVVTQKATLLISNHPVTSDDLDMPSLRDYEPRVASRLSDRRLCRWVPVIAEDYRVSGDHTDT
jgi:DNA replication protein DnaC